MHFFSEVEGHCSQLMNENSPLNVLQLFTFSYFTNPEETFSSICIKSFETAH